MEIGNFCNTRFSAVCYYLFCGQAKKYFRKNTFHLKAQFKTVSGLKVGNNVRFSGINIGNVNEVGVWI